MVNYPKGWGEINLGDSLSYIQPNKYISNVMQDKGKNPVLTAGKYFVLGYSNETNIYENFPVILFEDFNTEVRYIDFKFLVRSSATKFLSLKNEENNLRFLYYKLANLNYVIESHERHWIKKFAGFSMKVPKIEEQNKVVEVILYFDKHIENLSKLIEKKKMIRDGAVEDLISGDSRLSTFSDEWINNKMEDIAVINQGLQIPISSRQTYKTKNNYLYITIEFLKENNSKRYYVENPPTNTVCNKDSILMTRTGNTGQVVTGVSGVFHNNFFDIKYDKSKIDNNFLYYLLISKRYNTEIINVAGASTIPDLKHKDFYNISINYPKDIKEQKEIAKILMSMDKEIENLEKEKEKYLQLKSGAMDDLLTGKIRLV